MTGLSLKSIVSISLIVLCTNACKSTDINKSQVAGSSIGDITMDIVAAKLIKILAPDNQQTKAPYAKTFTCGRLLTDAGTTSGTSACLKLLTAKKSDSNRTFLALDIVSPATAPKVEEVKLKSNDNFRGIGGFYCRNLDDRASIVEKDHSLKIEFDCADATGIPVVEIIRDKVDLNYPSRKATVRLTSYEFGKKETIAILLEDNPIYFKEGPIAFFKD